MVDRLSRVNEKKNLRERAINTDERQEKLKHIKSMVDYSDIDGIFGSMIDEELSSGIFFSTINLSMMIVIAASAYLWFKLNKTGNFV